MSKCQTQNCLALKVQSHIVRQTSCVKHLACDSTVKAVSKLQDSGLQMMATVAV